MLDRDIIRHRDGVRCRLIGVRRHIDREADYVRIPRVSPGVAFVLKDIVFGAAGYLLGRYRPELVKKMAGEEQPRGYRTR